MPRTFAFLRAINVGGHTVPMARLKQLFEGFGLGGVETFIASGNVAFEAAGEAEADLAARLEAGLEAALGYEVAVFLRSERALLDLVRACPFAAEEVAAAAALNVAFLAAPLTQDQAARLQALATEVDAFRAAGREVWWLCRVRQGESRFSNTAFERALKVRATFRGFNTLQRWAARHSKP